MLRRGAVKVKLRGLCAAANYIVCVPFRSVIKDSVSKVPSISFLLWINPQLSSPRGQHYYPASTISIGLDGLAGTFLLTLALRSRVSQTYVEIYSLRFLWGVDGFLIS